MNDTGFNGALTVLAGVLVALGLAAGLLSDRSFDLVFNEDGIVEWVALVAWLAAAAVFFLGAVSQGDALAWLAALVCFGAALREADLHKRLTGYSVVKLRFYTGDAFPLWEKIVAALVVVPIGIAAVLLAAAFVRRLLAGGARRASMRLVLVTIGLLVFSKLLDRAPAVLLDWYAIALSSKAQRWMLAYEEGIEALLPVALILAFVVAKRERQRSREPLSSPRGAG